MSIPDLFLNKKGSTFNKIGKHLAQNILNGQTSILLDCFDLVSSRAGDPAQMKIRSGASKVIEVVALNRPDMVAPYLEKLIPALSVEESKTRSLIIRAIGFCAHLNKPVAERALYYAEKYIDQKKDLSLTCSTDLFLGDFGAISEMDAQRVFPLLEKSIEKLIVNEQDWILDAIYKLFKNLSNSKQNRCLEFAEQWKNSSRKSTLRKVKRILRLRGNEDSSGS